MKITVCYARGRKNVICIDFLDQFMHLNNIFLKIERDGSVPQKHTRQIKIIWSTVQNVYVEPYSLTITNQQANLYTRHKNLLDTRHTILFKLNNNSI